MKVLFISSDNNKTSGAFLCLVELNRYILDNTDIKTLIILPKHGDGVELLDKYNIPYRLIPSFSWITYKGKGLKAIAKTIFKSLMVIYNMYAIIKIRLLIRNEKIDLVHTNTIFSYVGAYAALKEKIPHLWHLREDINRDYNSRILHSNYGYELIKKSSQIIAVSNVIKNAYSKSIPSEKISVIYDGVSTRLYKKRDILKNDLITFTCIGALVQHKNQSELIKASYLLKRRGIKQFRVKFVGRGPNEYTLKQLVKEYKLENEIEFCGVYDDITEVLRVTDVLCVTSLSEAFGRTTVEGMLHGCLVIGASNAYSATRELVENNVTGFLYKSGDIDGLCELMMLTCDNQKHKDLQCIAECGQNNARLRYVTKANADKIISFYDAILS